MKLRLVTPTSLSRRALRRLTIAILLVGFGSAAAIYLLAGSEPSDPSGYEPLQTKRYVHDLELYGGKANVMAAEFREWFVDLWQGRQLALTIAVLTVLIVLVVRFIAKPRPQTDPSPPRRRARLKRAA